MVLQWLIEDFREDGGQQYGWRRQSIILANFPQKLHENEKKIDPSGHVPGATLDPPMF